jgi:tRNA modification GTPase
MNDTIVALATPPGLSGLAVIRLSGENAIGIADSCFIGLKSLKETASHTIHYGKISNKGNLVDFVTASVFREPNSYTGENVVEIGCHGGILLSQEIINILIENGARLAEPGEFTKRAFINGKMDLTQVEAVADIIHSASIPGIRTSARQLAGEFTSKLSIVRKELIDICSMLELELDFADESLQFTDRENISEKIKNIAEYCNELASSYKSAEVLRSGYFVGIAGFPNSGKSTLFNALLGRKRAIVNEMPGTTRDYLEESIYINDIKVFITDTAGIRDTVDTIEIEGIRFAESVLEQSNMILIVNDVNISFNHSVFLLQSLLKRFPDTNIIIIQNKIDLFDSSDFDDSIMISAKFNIGIEKIKEYIYTNAKKDTERINDVLINQRHSIILKNVEGSLNQALNAIKEEKENEIISYEVREAVKFIGELTGEVWNEEILNNIFSKFCIGK